MLIISNAPNTGKTYFENKAFFRQADAENDLSTEFIFEPVNGFPQGATHQVKLYFLTNSTQSFIT
jgi:hypothetical protein